MACLLQTVVDIATLTGAAGIALGNETGALFANTDSLAAAVDEASRQTGGAGCQAGRGGAGYMWCWTAMYRRTAVLTVGPDG